jgi:predicted DNA-binding antitoxin AbrB/MazE fold protein
MTGIPAIYKDGAFYPLQAVELPEQTNVVVVLPQASDSDNDQQLQGILRTAGVWADIPGIDDILQEMEDMRQSATYRDEPQ